MLPFEVILLLGKLAPKGSMIIMSLCQPNGIESNSDKSKSWDDDTLAHEHWDGFRILMFNGVKNECSDVIYEVEDFKVRSVYMQVNNLVT